MRLHSSSLLTLSVLSTTLIACGGDPPSPSEVRSALRNDLGYVIDQGVAASEATANLPTGGAFGFATVALGNAETATRLLAPIDRLMRSDNVVKGRNYLDEEEGGLDSDAIVQKLEQELFTDANHVGDGVYRVPASLVCTTTTYDETTGTETTGLDPECATEFDKIQLRIRVADEDPGLRFFIQVDANHDEPLSIFLAHDELAVTVNLDDATDAMQALAPLFGETAPNADLSGQVTSSIKIHGVAHAEIGLSFDRAISIKFAEQGIDLDGAAATRFASAAGQIFTIGLDANAPKADLALGLGATTAHVPGDEFDPQTTDFALGGATVDAHFQANTLTLNNISLGQSTTTVSIDGAQAIAIDLNANDGRSLDATITHDPATGTETLEVSPRLDLSVAIDHGLLGDEAPVYDVTRVQLDGSLRGNELTSQVEVLTGSLTVTTNPAQYGFSATAGQCIQATEIYDDVTYTSYTQYSVGACQ